MSTKGKSNTMRADILLWSTVPVGCLYTDSEGTCREKGEEGEVSQRVTVVVKENTSSVNVIV